MTLFPNELVLTGEGQINGQTGYGKVPVGVARLAGKYADPAVIQKVIAPLLKLSKDATSAGGAEQMKESGKNFPVQPASTRLSLGLSGKWQRSGRHG